MPALPARREGLAATPWVRNRVLLVLVVAGLLASAGLPFLGHAPNRLVSGVGIPLGEVLRSHGAGGAAGLLGAALAAGAFLPRSARTHGFVAGVAAVALFGAAWLAGRHAVALSAADAPLGRTSLGSGFWCLAVLAWLAAADALQALRLSLGVRTAAHALVLAPVAVLCAAGGLDALSLLKEYDHRRDVFQAAWLTHLWIVVAALVPTLLVGVPLGVATARRPGVAQPVFAVLNIVQTIPSIALFGLLIAPLAWLAAAAPGLGVNGIGMVPAVIALALYSLLPIVHGVRSGLEQVPRDVTLAAVGMGLSPRQVFWKVEVPLALPLLLSGLRVTTVQAVGLAVVAALIGAGGLGAIMFQGLLSSAVDLVLLGVLPVVATAVVVDAAFKLLTALVAGGAGPGR